MDQLELVLCYLFPRGKRRGSQFYIGNLQGEPGDSLVVELEGPKRGLWIDFATGESGDVLALWASTRGYTLPADFSDLLEDAGDWLMVPQLAAAPVLRATTIYDDLGPHTRKWDYLAADGRLIACVYRHDTPTGKQYRPWDVRARAMRMPEPRPLYNLPAIAGADAGEGWEKKGPQPGSEPFSAPSPAPASFAEFAASSGQLAIDQAIAGMPDDAFQEAMAGLIEPLLAAIDAEDTFEDALAAAEAAYPAMDKAKLQHLLARAMFGGEAYGRQVEQ